MIKGKKPEFSEVDDIYINNIPKNNGIWIEKNSRNKIEESLNNSNLLNSKYEIDENGYVKIKEKGKQNDNDKKLENIINGSKQYIFSISSICYIVDDVTGKILDYNFENMDKYQTYEYFEDNNKMIIFITKNSNKQLEEKDIIESIINLL